MRYRGVILHQNQSRNYESLDKEWGGGTEESKFDWLNRKPSKHEKISNPKNSPNLKFKSKSLKYHTPCLKVLLDIDKADSLNKTNTIF